MAVVLLWGRAASADPLIISPSVALAETFTDNVQFDTDDDADAITRLRLGLGFLYVTESSATTFNAGTSAFYRARSGQATFNLGSGRGASFRIASRPVPVYSG
jgi:hypothetical protein